MEEACRREALCCTLESFIILEGFLEEKTIYTKIFKEASVISHVTNNIHDNYILFDKDNYANNYLEKKIFVTFIEFTSSINHHQQLFMHF